jgi:hypothetical protein
LKIDNDRKKFFGGLKSGLRRPGPKFLPAYAWGLAASPLAPIEATAEDVHRGFRTTLILACQ